MELIVLEGNPHIGKTDTINVVYQLILQAGYNQIPGYFQDLANNDFLDILTNGKQKVGIVSQGDYAVGANSVKNHLANLQSQGCDKAICACTLGVSKQKIQTAISAYVHIKVTKLPTPDISLRRIENNRDANTIAGML